MIKREHGYVPSIVELTDVAKAQQKLQYQYLESMPFSTYTYSEIQEFQRNANVLQECNLKQVFFRLAKVCRRQLADPFYQDVRRIRFISPHPKVQSTSFTANKGDSVSSHPQVEAKSDKIIQKFIPESISIKQQKNIKSKELVNEDCQQQDERTQLLRTNTKAKRKYQ